MGINTNLNIAPYFDDFDETKQFNRILFKPAYAVQARELTQLQTILQKQVERFGTNIYKEGTIISGVNITERPDIRYVKLNDQTNFSDPTIYDPSDTTKYYAVGETSGLRAEILKGQNGFQTQAPNLKTFYIKYLNSNVVSGSEVQEFIQGEFLTIEDQDGVSVSTTVGGSTSTLKITVSTTTNHVGPSYGVSVEEGIIYQKGHFIYVEPQFIVISKYSNEPNNISVGFDVEESIINANQESSLLDNAQGYNNENAPGADRLKLRPVLTSYTSSTTPEDFFALMKFESGEPIMVRDVTEFNSIAKEMARRTYEESGNYVANGMEVTLEQNQVGYGGSVTHAVVAPGKAYVFGYEIKNVSERRLPIDLVTEKQTKTDQIAGVDYGAYYEFDWGGTANNAVLNAFSLDGTRYDLKDSGDSVIGKCSVKNVKAGSATENGRIYVYAIEKDSGEEETAVAKIADTPVVGGLKEVNKGAMIFKVSGLSVDSMDNVNITRRVRADVGSTANVTISSTASSTPLTSNIVGVDASQNFVNATSVTQNGTNVDIVFDAPALYVYYDAIVNNVDRDSLDQVVTYVNTTVSSGIGNLGLPNAIRLLQVIDNNGAGNDVTHKFRLVNNQKEGFYDYSYIKLKPGETLSNSNVNVKFVALKRTSNFGNSFLDAGSYDGVQKHLLLPYTGASGVVYDHLNCIDFRPYAAPLVAYATTLGTAGTVSPAAVTFDTVVPVSYNSNVFYDLSYYLSRIDSIGVGSDGSIKVYMGNPSEIPSPQRPRDAYILADIFVPGNMVNLRSASSPSVKNVATKNYTMKDIETIDKKIARLTEAVSLTMLEMESDNLFIPDENGLNRFKNGILVDSFRNLRIADLKDPEYSASINRLMRYAAPKFSEFQVDLRVKDGNNINQSFDDIVTLADTGAMVNFISQPYATNVRRPSTGTINYRGKTAIYPQYDATYDNVSTPDVNVNVLGSIVETNSGTEVGTYPGIVNYGADGTTITNSDEPPSLSDPIETVGVGSGLLDDIKKNFQIRYCGTTETQTDSNEYNSGSISDVIQNTNHLSSIELDGYTLNFGTTDGVTKNLEPYITDFTLKPYIAGRQVRVLSTGMRPNTRHYVYFGRVGVSQYCYPGQVTATTGGNLDVRRCAIYGSLGSAIYSDANGVVSFILDIPESTFFVGEHEIVITDAMSYNSINATATSYSKSKYRSYNFQVETQSVNITTRNVEIEAEVNLTQETVSTNYYPVRDSEGNTFYDVDGDGRGDTEYLSEAVNYVNENGGNISSVNNGNGSGISGGAPSSGSGETKPGSNSTVTSGSGIK